MYDVFHYFPNNPVYQPTFEPKFDRVKYQDKIEDDSGNEFWCEIEYHYYRYECRSRVVYYSFRPLGAFHMTEMSMNESVMESINLLEFGLASFECNGTFIN